jgi:hypothetical protein
MMLRVGVGVMVGDGVGGRGLCEGGIMWWWVLDLGREGFVWHGISVAGWRCG